MSETAGKLAPKGRLRVAIQADDALRREQNEIPAEQVVNWLLR